MPGAFPGADAARPQAIRGQVGGARKRHSGHYLRRCSKAITILARSLIFAPTDRCVFDYSQLRCAMGMQLSAEAKSSGLGFTALAPLGSCLSVRDENGGFMPAQRNRYVHLRLHRVVGIKLFVMVMLGAAVALGTAGVASASTAGRQSVPPPVTTPAPPGGFTAVVTSVTITPAGGTIGPVMVDGVECRRPRSGGSVPAGCTDHHHSAGPRRDHADAGLPRRGWRGCRGQR